MSVYFIQAGENGPIKVGVALDVAQRLKTLQTGSPQELHLLGTIPGDEQTEHTIHLRFGGDRVRGEWFQPSPDLLSFISEAATRAHMPLLQRIAAGLASRQDLDQPVLVAGRRKTWADLTAVDLMNMDEARFRAFRRGVLTTYESFAQAYVRVRNAVFQHGTVGAAFEAGGFPPADLASEAGVA